MVAAAIVAVLAAFPSLFESHLLAAVSLTVVAPAGASVGVTVQITGTGFDPVASKNTVTLTPATGAPVTVVAETIATLDANKGLRRIGIKVPAGLAVGTAPIRVTNTTTKESAGGRSLEVIALSLPETRSGTRGAQQLAVRVNGSPNTQFVAGRTTVTFGAGITVTATQVTSPTSFVATISISPTAALGTRALLVVTSTQTAQLLDAFTVTDPNRPPTITSSPVVTASEAQPYSYQVTAADPDADSVSFRLVSGPAGMTVSPAGLVSWVPQTAQVGSQNVTVEAFDGRGGTNQQAFQITVAAAPALQSIDVTPGLVRFAAAGDSRPLAVSGTRSDGQILDLTTAAGTTYESSNRFVCSVAPNGVVTAVANGDATITARNGSLGDTAAIAVEIGVTLDAIELTPAVNTLHAAGATQRLTLTGRFSDGSSRDLTTATGTTYDLGSTGIVSITTDATVTALATGQVTVIARHATRSATAIVT